MNISLDVVTCSFASFIVSIIKHLYMSSLICYLPVHVNIKYKINDVRGHITNDCISLVCSPACKYSR